LSRALRLCREALNGCQSRQRESKKEGKSKGSAKEADPFFFNSHVFAT
jgi:hypothetical protein